MELRGRSVLITGGTSGIGRALAEQLARAGARVMVCGRDPARLDAVKRAHPELETALCDVGDPAALLALVEEADAVLGGLDVLVNNAGIQLEVDFGTLEHPEDALARVQREVAVNLVAPAQLTRAAMPLLADSGAPTVVFVTSALATAPKASAPVYCATKAGVHNLARGLRAQLGGSGVRVMEVVPPVVDTAMTRGRDAGKKASAGEVAAAIVDGLRRGRDEVRVGVTRWVPLLHRLAPRWLERKMAAS